MELYTFDSRRDVFIGDTKTTAIRFAALHVISLAKLALESHHSFSIALSGGSTPTQLYEAFLDKDFASELDWQKVNVFWSDERAVPHSHPESNYGTAMHAFSKKPLSNAHFFPMNADRKDQNEACKEYESLITKHCYKGRFDLILLGVGTDGHTASLFPNSPSLENDNDKLVVMAEHPETSQKRMSVSATCIQHARKLMILIFGKDKADIVEEIFFGDKSSQECPAKLVGEGLGQALFILDNESASKIKKRLAAGDFGSS